MKTYTNWKLYEVEIEKLEKQGKKLKEIAKTLGVNYFSLRSYLKRRKFGRELRAPVDKEKVREMLLAGVAQSDIANELNISQWSIQRVRYSLEMSGLLEPLQNIKWKCLQEQVNILFEELEKIRIMLNGKN